jgi:E3 ubiquitin-protein ligase makorin
LHPFRPEEREEHMKSCENKQKHLEALKKSQEVECCVCLERVLSKPTAAERKFGVLSECDHPFCISCIRNWRSSNPTLGMDVNSTLRACPICRKLSYFVVPSVIWYATSEEKQDIVNTYKAKLK